MIWLYRLAFLPLLLVTSPYYLKRMLRRGGYRKSFQHRFGMIKPLPPKKEGVSRIWIQAVSVGEVKAIAPLVTQLSESGTFEVVLTTTTSTGYALARDTLSAHTLKIAVFPLDFWLFSRKAWSRIAPDKVVLMESELWPEHLHQARKRGCPLIVLNARLSDRSYRRYQKLRPIAARLLRHPERILASSEADGQRLRELGAEVEVAGNIKFDTPVEPILNEDEKLALKAELGLPKDSLVLMGSSTWPGEEKLLLETVREARDGGLSVHLLIVPRHAERRQELKDFFKDQPETVVFRSEGRAERVDVSIADTTGELVKISQVADVVFVGKSLPPNDGGQTPIEAAALGLPIVYGSQMSNFRDVTKSLEGAEAAIKANDAGEVQAHLMQLLKDPVLRTNMASKAQAWHQSNRGALARCIAAVMEL